MVGSGSCDWAVLGESAAVITMGYIPMAERGENTRRRMTEAALMAALAIWFLVVAGCSTISIEESDIAEMWAFAYAHRQYDREDSRDVRYVGDPAAECAKLGTTVHKADGMVRGCTVLGAVNYSILATDASAYELAHEAAHRRYGGWHHGYIYFTAREWAMMRGRK